jgi:hypothetical protein
MLWLTLIAPYLGFYNSPYPLRSLTCMIRSVGSSVTSIEPLANVERALHTACDLDRYDKPIKEICGCGSWDLPSFVE